MRMRQPLLRGAIVRRNRGALERLSVCLKDGACDERDALELQPLDRGGYRLDGFNLVMLRLYFPAHRRIPTRQSAMIYVGYTVCVLVRVKRGLMFD